MIQLTKLNAAMVSGGCPLPPNCKIVIEPGCYRPNPKPLPENATEAQVNEYIFGQIQSNIRIVCEPEYRRF